MVFTLKAMKTIVSKAPRYQYVLTLSKYYKKAALTYLFPEAVGQNHFV